MHRKRSISSGIWENEVVQALSDPAFKVWVGIWSVSDRNGVFPWRPRKWAMRFAPRNIHDAERLFQELLDGGLVEKFEAEGEAYGFSVKWSRHQDPHIDEPPVYPMPASENFTPCPPRHWTKRNAKWMAEVYGLAPCARGENGTGAATSAGTGAQLGADPAGPSRPSLPSRPSREKSSSPGLDQPDLDTNIENPILLLPCSGKGPSTYPVTQTHLDAWREAYPGIDALVEAKRLRVWLEQSPHKLREARRMGSLISTWLTNAQAKAEKGNSAPVREENPSQRSAADQDFLDRLEMSHRQEDAQ
jgi:hypothetical protein